MKVNPCGQNSLFDRLGPMRLGFFEIQRSCEPFLTHPSWLVHVRTRLIRDCI
jgi:hypothetical protein